MINNFAFSHKSRRNRFFLHVASCAEEALENLVETSVDIVVTDIHKGVFIMIKGFDGENIWSLLTAVISRGIFLHVV